MPSNKCLGPHTQSTRTHQPYQKNHRHTMTTNLLRIIGIISFCTLFTGCGHSYEGKYNITGKMAFVVFGGIKTITIGNDYIELQGNRKNLEDIFVRDSDGVEYLILKSKDKEEAWRIIDHNTLMMPGNIVKLVRIE